MPDDTRLHCTIHDRSGLKRRYKGASDFQVNAAELLQCAEVETKYLARKPSLRSAPFTSQWMLKLHREMFGAVWRWAGKPRTHNTNIGVDWFHIGPQMESLALDLAAWDCCEVEKAARLHLRAVRIHPFADGNGRWARLLANIWLVRHGQPLVRWPEPALRTVDSPIRSEYIQSIKAADDGDEAGFLELHRRLTDVQGPGTSAHAPAAVAGGRQRRSST